MQLRLPGFTQESLTSLGVTIRDLYAEGATAPERVREAADDAYVRDLATAVGGALGGKVGVTPRLFLKKLVGDVLDRVDQFDDFDPRQHYRLTVSGGELTDAELTRALREVLLGTDPRVALTRRAEAGLAESRDEFAPHTTHPGGTLVTRSGSNVRWWTWAGYRANATLAATLRSVADPVRQPTDAFVRLREDLTSEMWQDAHRATDQGTALLPPEVNQRAVEGLKFSVALPPRLATATVAARLADFTGARAVLEEPVRFHTRPPA
ncbi:hypothetical protein AN216_06810 [Streptomyces oceani]|uniref:Uncharacterized protein n=1 Tax=Streptomyces oceani TaxID=1075402 RepID=A0A1E7KL47_9ACTN|nr:hypothetical protein AN216_06810 [Streptomyces oceani]